MNLDEMYPSVWMKPEDIQGSAQLVISGIAREEIGQGADARNENIVTFSNFDKRWTLNRTNAESIAMMYGKETDNWIGKIVTLYVTPVQGPNGIKPGIRVDTRPQTPGAAQAAPQAPQTQQAPRAPQPAGDIVTVEQMAQIKSVAESIWGAGCDADLNSLKNDVCRGAKWQSLTSAQGAQVLEALNLLKKPMAAAPAFPVEDDFDDSDPFSDQ